MWLRGTPSRCAQYGKVIHRGQALRDTFPKEKEKKVRSRWSREEPRPPPLILILRILGTAVRVTKAA